MGKLGNAKVFGGIGAILSLVGGFIPLIGVVLPLVGLILLFIAVKYIAEETKDDSIFRNYVLYFVCSIIAIVAAFAIIFITIGGFSFLAFLHSEEMGEPGNFDSIVALLGGFFIALIVAWILLIFGTMYLRKSYNHIAKNTKVDLFRTTGTVYFIGAITLIILIGGLILLIAKILEIVAFFSLPENIPSEMEAAPSEILS
ncbi:MAG TPA: DUF996 domain-containing protein [Thermoplasmatales archaeon]|nr:DUF996 domain-containing protein [Thermoplasmatales archaeon]